MIPNAENIYSILANLPSFLNGKTIQNVRIQLHTEEGGKAIHPASLIRNALHWYRKKYS